MKKHILDFLKRGCMAAFGGPVILAIIYGSLGSTGAAETIPAGDVCRGILSVTVMAFIAAGITAIYQVEQFPLPLAIATHAVVLYLDYLLMYLLNSWLPRNSHAIALFSVIFAAGFALVWLIIWLVTRQSTRRLNEKMRGDA